MADTLHYETCFPAMKKRVVNIRIERLNLKEIAKTGLKINGFDCCNKQLISESSLKKRVVVIPLERLNLKKLVTGGAIICNTDYNSNKSQQNIILTKSKNVPRSTRPTKSRDVRKKFRCNSILKRLLSTRPTENIPDFETRMSHANIDDSCLNDEHGVFGSHLPFDIDPSECDVQSNLWLSNGNEEVDWFDCGDFCEKTMKTEPEDEAGLNCDGSERDVENDTEFGSIVNGNEFVTKSADYPAQWLRVNSTRAGHKSGHSSDLQESSDVLCLSDHLESHPQCSEDVPNTQETRIEPVKSVLKDPCLRANAEAAAMKKTPIKVFANFGSLKLQIRSAWYFAMNSGNLN